MSEKNTCEGCRFAEWDRTASGRLSPLMGGRCTYYKQNPPKEPPIPAAFYWLGVRALMPSGGFISRDKKRVSVPCPLKEPARDQALKEIGS